MVAQMPDNALLITLLKDAVAKCYQNDMTLIDRSMEQACVARIYYYMQNLINTKEIYTQLKDYNLDCEYNKNGESIKPTYRCSKGTRPDIVLHKRGTNEHNLLVAEFKSRKAKYKKYQYDNKKCIDEIKLEDFTGQGVYNYQLGVWVKLHKRKAKYIYFKHGQKVSGSDLGVENV